MIRVEQIDGPVLLLRAEGRINALTANDFYAEVLRATARTQDDVIMDTADVTYVSSAGLRTFLHIWRYLNADQRGFHVFNMRPHIQETFNIIGFHHIIPLHDDMEDAMAALQGQS